MQTLVCKTCVNVQIKTTRSSNPPRLFPSEPRDSYRRTSDQSGAAEEEVQTVVCRLFQALRFELRGFPDSKTLCTGVEALPATRPKPAQGNSQFHTSSAISGRFENPNSLEISNFQRFTFGSRHAFLLTRLSSSHISPVSYARAVLF